MSLQQPMNPQPVYINFNTQRNLPLPEPESHEQLLSHQASNPIVGPSNIDAQLHPQPLNEPLAPNNVNNEGNININSNNNNLDVQAGNPAVGDGINSIEINLNIRLIEERKIYRGWLIEFLLNCTFSHSFGILMVLFYLVNIKYIFMFIPLFIWDIYDLYLILRQIKSRNVSQKLTKRYYLIMIEKYDIILIRIMLVLYIETHWYFATFTLIPLVFYCFVRCVTYGIDKESGECHTMIDFLAVAYRMFLLIQLTTIFCKVDGFIDWQWKEVLWSYWVFFSILIGIDFGLILMTISKLCNCFIANVDWTELIGLTWFLAGSVTFTIVSCLMTVGISAWLDDGDETVLVQSLYFIVGSYVVNCLLVLIFRNFLIVFLKGVNEEDNTNSSVSKEKTSGAHHESFTIPKFLTKFSSTYFKKSDIVDTPQMQNQSDSKKKGKKIKKKTVEPSQFKTATLRPIRSNSFADKPNFDDLPQDPKKRTLILDTYGTKSSFNDLGRLLSHNELKYDSFKIQSTKELAFLSPKRDGIVESKGIEIVNFTAGNTKNPYENDPVIHFSPPEEEKKEPPNINSMRLDLKINAADFRVIRNMDLIKSATLPKKYPDYLSNSMNLSPPQKGSEIDPQSPEKLGDKSVNCCLICMDKAPDAVFMDCGHGGACYECAVELFRATNECYLCRKEIKQVLQIDMNARGEFIRVMGATQVDHNSPNKSH